MKKKLAGLALIFGFSICSVTAQSLSFGLKLGANLHKVSGKSFKEQFNFGYHFGGFAEVGLTSKYAVQPEVYFSQVNVDSSSSFSSIYQFKKITKVKLSYLNIPVLLNYKPNKFLALQIGPQFGILLNQNVNLVQNGKDAFKKGDFSMTAGAQVKILKFRAYARYIVGLSNLNDIDSREKWRNQTVHLGVAVSL